MFSRVHAPHPRTSLLQAETSQVISFSFKTWAVYVVFGEEVEEEVEEVEEGANKCTVSNSTYITPSVTHLLAQAHSSRRSLPEAERPPTSGSPSFSPFLGHVGRGDSESWGGQTSSKKLGAADGLWLRSLFVPLMGKEMEEEEMEPPLLSRAASSHTEVRESESLKLRSLSHRLSHRAPTAGGGRVTESWGIVGPHLGRP
ncbi:unnamed protein product [Pleuronectes platessa]|uniref:Uncharacterized protein n=1 Tax=Pleuronectes platessa TaxID=8262 RepID=A0A9N7Z8N9_PLEPL|nr:unnamed protein product [Pleuronectes platessa]